MAVTHHSTNRTQRRARLEARITPEQKELIEHAAALEGRSISDFVVSSVQAAALETIHQHEIITLSARDSRIFVEALLNPPEPNEALREAMRLSREILGE